MQSAGSIEISDPLLDDFDESVRDLDAAALAVGRLDAAARGLEPGVQALLVARCGAMIANEDVRRLPDARGIIAQLHGLGEGATPSELAARALALGADRVRSGSAPTVRWLAAECELSLDGTDPRRVADIDTWLLRLRSERPGVAVAVALSGALSSWSPLAAATFLPLALLQSGAVGGAWCTVPPAETGVQRITAALARSAHDAERAVHAAQEALLGDEQKVEGAYGRAAHGALRVLRSFRRWPLLDVPSAARRLRCTRPTVAAALERLTAQGLVAEVTGRGRDRLWCYEALAAAMAATGTGAGGSAN